MKKSNNTLKGAVALDAMSSAIKNGHKPSVFEWWKDADIWIPARFWSDLAFYAFDGGIRWRKTEGELSQE